LDDSPHIVELLEAGTKIMCAALIDGFVVGRVGLGREEDFGGDLGRFIRKRDIGIIKGPFGFDWVGGSVPVRRVVESE
jgi:hypothetical protein